MPELPEVETVARNLAPKIIGKTCDFLIISDPKLGLIPEQFKTQLVKNVSRLGKEILFHFVSQNTNLFLLIHLRMSGRLLFNQGKDLEDLEKSEHHFKHKILNVNTDNFSKHIRAIFKFSDAELYFFDVRRFGTFKWLETMPTLPEGVIDPTTESFSFNNFINLTEKSAKLSLKNFLLRQDRISGIGNIYASEIAFRSKILPTRLVGSLKASELQNLFESISYILCEAILNGGTTISDFQLDDFSTGNYQNLLKVYGNAGKNCSTCKAEIVKVNQNQRSTFYCPSCQK